MIRISLSIFLLLTTIIYCVLEKNKANKILEENCIEIYLYEEYVMPEYCVWYKDTDNYDVSNRAAEKSIVDTIENKYLQGKEFELNNKIDKVLIIKNDEITNYTNENLYLLIKSSKYNELFNWKSKIDLKQFVITVNKKPVLNGYFYNAIKSYHLNDEILMYDSVGNDTKHKTKSRFHKNYRKSKLCKLYLWSLKENISNFNLKKGYPELYQAFKNSNRLIE